MTAIGDDRILPILGVEALTVNDYLTAYGSSPVLFCYGWEHANTFLPNGSQFVGISLHLSSEQQDAFHRQLYDSYDRRYGKEVPDSYYRLTERFVMAVDDVLYRYVEESTGRKIFGVFVGAPNLKYLPRLGLVQPSTSFDNILQLHGDEYTEQLMTVQKVLKELSDDTHLWYTDVDRR